MASEFNSNMCQQHTIFQISTTVMCLRQDDNKKRFLIKWKRDVSCQTEFQVAAKILMSMQIADFLTRSHILAITN